MELSTSMQSKRLEMNLKKAIPLQEQAVKVLASSIYRQLQQEGCEYKDIINVSSQLLSLVTDELQCTGDE